MTKNMLEPYFREMMRNAGLSDKDVDVEFFTSMLECNKHNSMLIKIRDGIKTLSTQIDKMIMDKQTDIAVLEHVIAHCETLKENYMSVIGSNRKTLTELFSKAYEEAMKDKPLNYVTGYQVSGAYQDLINKLDGINPGHYLFVAAPHVGKTLTSIELINGLLNNRYGVATAHFVSADDDTRKIIKTMVALQARMKRNTIDRNITQNPEVEKITKAYKFFIEAEKQKMLTIKWDIDNWNDFEYYVIQTLKQYKHPVFFIDGPSNIACKEKIYDKDEKMNYVPNFIHKICGRYNVPIILTYELTKSGFDKPTMADVKGGGKWVYNASAIMLMYKHPEYYGNNAKPASENEMYVKIDCVKNKNSDWLGSYDLMFDKDKSTFRGINEYDRL